MIFPDMVSVGSDRTGEKVEEAEVPADQREKQLVRAKTKDLKDARDNQEGWQEQVNLPF